MVGDGRRPGPAGGGRGLGWTRSGSRPEGGPRARDVVAFSGVGGAETPVIPGGRGPPPPAPRVTRGRSGSLRNTRCGGARRGDAVLAHARSRSLTSAAGGPFVALRRALLHPRRGVLQNGVQRGTPAPAGARRARAGAVHRGGTPGRHRGSGRRFTGAVTGAGRRRAAGGAPGRRPPGAGSVAGLLVLERGARHQLAGVEVDGGPVKGGMLGARNAKGCPVVPSSAPPPYLNGWTYTHRAVRARSGVQCSAEGAAPLRARGSRRRGGVGFRRVPSGSGCHSGAKSRGDAGLCRSLPVDPGRRRPPAREGDAQPQWRCRPTPGPRV